MTESRRLLRHFLAALAYRTQKALRGAPDDFADFRAGGAGPVVAAGPAAAAAPVRPQVRPPAAPPSRAAS